jgi:hypothetical protein
METQHARPNSFSKDLKCRCTYENNIKYRIDEPIKTAITLLLDSQSKIFMITENNEPVGTLNRDQIIAAFPKR